MGVVYDFVCGNCQHTEEIFEGSGDAGINCITYFCATCGEMGIQEKPELWSDEHPDAALEEKPVCPDHPEKAMHKLERESKVPCAVCHSGSLAIEPSSIKNFD